MENNNEGSEKMVYLNWFYMILSLIMLVAIACIEIIAVLEIQLVYADEQELVYVDKQKPDCFSKLMSMDIGITDIQSKHKKI